MKPIYTKTVKKKETIPKDMKLYDSIKQSVYKTNPKHSAYRSGTVVKKYKIAFKKKYGTYKNPYYGKKPVLNGLPRWFKEDWKSDTGKYKYTSKSSVYRPEKRITSKTPLTFSELTKKEIQAAKRKKKLTGRVTKFRK